MDMQHSKKVISKKSKKSNQNGQVMSVVTWQ